MSDKNIQVTKEIYAALVGAMCRPSCSTCPTTCKASVL